MLGKSARIFPKPHNHNQIQLIKEAFDVIGIDDAQKLIIKHRFTSLLEEYGDRSWKYAFAFHSLRITITIGSLIVPAILSVQFTASQSSASVYWIVWFLSLLVTISNALVTLLKVDKKYYILNTVFHHIVSEGWLYIELSGKYSGYKTPGETPTHKNQFVYFCHSLEKIRMKQVEDEYFKLTEINNHSNNQAHDQLVPPTPLKPLPFSTTAGGIKSNGLVNDSVRNTTVLFTPKEEEDDTEDSTSLELGGSTKEINQAK
jgi:hypothetical protein